MRLRVALSLLSAWVSVSAAELIVVTPERMAAEAAELAELHRRYQAMDVEVMVVADSVAANPEKLKSVIVDAYRRDCFGSLLLVGRSYGLSHSATWMGRLVSADDSGPDVAVGRIPADEPEQLAAYVAKARAYLARGRSGNVGSESVMVSSDYGDGFRHLRNAEALCGVMPDAIIRKVYLDMEPVPLVEAQCLSPQSRRAIERGLDEGVHTWIHFGHGSSTALSARGLWDVTAARSSRCRRPPWVMLMSCDTGLPSASDMNLCEAMVLNPLGGAMGVIGATDLTRPSINEDLMKIYMAARAKADRDATAGEVWLAAQRAAQACGYPAVGSYMQRYELFGDPALPLFLVPESAAIIVPADAVSPGEPFALDVSAPGATEVNVAVYAPPRRVDVDTIALNINNIKIWERRVALDGAGRVEVVLPPCAPGVGRIEASCGAAVRGSASLTIDDVVAAPFDTVAPVSRLPPRLRRCVSMWLTGVRVLTAVE